MLTKKEVVLDRDYVGINDISFCYKDGEMEIDSPSVWLPRVDYEEMGKPEVITVTIVSGDLLND